MCDYAERAEKLRSVISSGTDPINIVLAQVDPDAIACALGLRLLVRFISQNRRGTEIYYAGTISHPQNLQVVYRYGLVPSMLKPIDKMEHAGSAVALVDSCSVIDSRLAALGRIDPLIVIDHHRSEAAPTETEHSFVLIEDVGAACTLVVRLIQQLDVKIQRDYTWVATLLAFGIYNDTKGLVSANHHDHEAYTWIRALANENELAELVHYRLPSSFYAIERDALTNMTTRDGRLVTGVGMIFEEQGDFLAIIADSLIRMQNISIVVVWGIVGNRVRISARSADLTVPLDQYLAQRFGANAGAKLAPDGHGEGGGMLELGLGLWVSDGTKADICNMVRTRMAELVFGN